MLIRTVEWLNANRYRRYPFVDDADMSLNAGAYNGVCALPYLPDDVMLDFQAVALTNTYAAGTFKLSSIDVSPTALVFRFSIGNIPIALSVPSHAAYPYNAEAISNGARYSAVFGEGCANLLCAEPFTYTAAIPLQPALLVDQSRHRVDSVRAKPGTQATLAGRVFVEPGYNCDPVVMPGRVRLTAGHGWGAGRYCYPLSDDVISCREAVLRLNGQTASDDGNINLSVIGASVGPDPVDPNTVLIRTPRMFDNMKCG